MIPAVGQAVGPWTIESVSAEQMKTLAVLLDDPNPIHLDAQLVRDLGMGPTVINQGPANLGYIINMLQDRFPTGDLIDLRVRFLGNVFGGDRVSASGVVTGVDQDRAGRNVVSLTVMLDVEGRGPAVQGTAAVALKGA